MKHIFFILRVVSISVYSLTAYAVTDGHHLLNHCKHSIKASETMDVNYIKKHPYSIPYCQGFMDGVRGVSSYTRILFKESDSKVKACIPNGLNNAKITEIVVKYMQENPDILDQEAGLTAYIALVKAFPCK